MITGELLGGIPLFAAIPASERESIAAGAADVRLQPHEWVLHEGEAPSFFVVLEGTLSVFKNAGGVEQKVNSYAAGDFFGEVPLVLGAPAIASVQADTASRLARLDERVFHELISSCEHLNAEILRVMASRVNMLQKLSVSTPAPRVTVTGRRLDPACHQMRDFLVRNHIPFQWQERDTDSRGPIVGLPDGEELFDPGFREVAARLGLQCTPRRDEYDIAVIGGGPAGLAAAVYGASEGLCTLLIERVAPGGQAGTSSRIENYLGFPSGVSGDELSLRARHQAVRFGAEILVARDAEGIERDDAGFTLLLDGNERVRTRAIVLTTGVAWRRLDIPGIDDFLNRGVYYGAAQSEASAVRGQDVYLIGGGNSAGQAAMLFANYAERVTLLVRGPALAASMSQYLIDQLASKSNVRIRTMTEVTSVDGHDCLEFVTIADRASGEEVRVPCAALFVFIGARAETAWLPPSVIRDEWDFVCTGRDVMDLLAEGSGTWPLDRDPFLLETSTPGIFAAGDVRHGSIKRVAASVGDGSMAIAFVHQYLAEQRAAH